MPNGEFVPVQAAGLGVDRGQDWRLNFVPDLLGVDLSVVDFVQVRGMLGLGAGAPLHVLAVGDKYRRDVLGGNRAGLFTLRVMPLPGPDLWFDWLGLRAFDNYAGLVGRRVLTGLMRPAAADGI